MTKKIVNILFDTFSIKGEWDSEHEEYYFPISELIAKISDGNNIHEYMAIIKNHGINTEFKDKSEVISLKDLFRIIQLIPSPKSNQIMMWLAELGAKQIKQEIL